MPITRSLLTAPEKEQLFRHLLKHKVYPYRYRFQGTINSTTFNTNDAGGGAVGRYFTREFQPAYATGIIGIATGFIITPNSTTGTFAAVGSYRSTLSLQNLAGNTPDEGTEIYSNISNGGAINDFQVFFPLNYYVEARNSFFIHVWADQTTIAAGTSTITGHFTLLTMPTDIGG